MRRYIAGAMLMALAACWPAAARWAPGVGAAVFTLTSWVTLCTMWASATLVDWLVDRRHEPRPQVAIARAPEALDPEASASYARP